MHRRRYRQERWLHTRISEHLEGALKREAQRRRLPVSLLVRNVLEGALELVENIVAGTVPPRARGDELGDVYGWQELILNRGSVCARCETTLATGALAYRGLRDAAGPPVFMCTSCVRRLRRAPAAGEKQEEAR